MPRVGRETILAADVGGTNCRLELFYVNRSGVETSATQTLQKGKRAPGTLHLKRAYMNQDFCCFEDVLRVFLKEAQIKEPPVSACFAVAGPVRNNTVRFTNRDNWEIDGDRIATEFLIKRVLLVNDFVALGYGLLTLDEATECLCLQDAPRQPNAPIACIGAGTGLGQCFLTPVGNDDDLSIDEQPQEAPVEYNCFPSEGGHAEFAPRSELEFGLVEFLKEKFDQKHRISVERVVSGKGLVNVYEYFTSKFPDKVNPAVQALMDAAGDMKGSVIAEHSKTDELCRQTMELFATAYGSEAGVAALKWLPYGGLYLTGGLTPKNIDLIKDPNGPFMTALLDKGRVKSLLYSVPIYAVIAENVTERGSAYVAYKQFTLEVLAQAKKKKSYIFSMYSYSGVGEENESLNFSVFSVVVLVAGAYVLGQLRGSLGTRR